MAKINPLDMLSVATEEISSSKNKKPSYIEKDSYESTKSKQPIKAQQEMEAVELARRFGVYLTAEDEQQLRHISAFLASQGRRTSDALILRTGLYLMKTGDSLLNAFDETAKKDKRSKSSKLA